MDDHVSKPGFEPAPQTGIDPIDYLDALQSMQACMANAPVSIFRLGEAGNIVEVNRHACAGLGYTRDELIGMTVFDIDMMMTPEQWGEYRKNLKSQDIFTREGLYRRKDGSTVPVKASFNNYEIKGVQYSHAFVQDNSECKKNEELLKASENRFRTLSEASFEGVALTKQGIFVDLNNQFASMFGYTREELLGKVVVSCVAPQDRQRVTEFIRRGSLEPYEHAALRKDGSQFPVLIRAKTLMIEGEELRVSVIRDISEQKQAEENNKRLLRLESEALQVARLGYWEYDVAEAYFTFNDQYYILHGTTAEQAGGYQMSAQTFAENYVHPDDAHLVIDAIQLAQQTNDPKFRFQIDARLLKVNGEIFDVTLWFRIEKDETGKTIKLFGVNQDITERKQAETALRESEFFLRKSQDVGNLGSYYFDVQTGTWISSEKLDQIFGIDAAYPRTVEGWTTLIHPDDRASMLSHLMDHVITRHNRFDKEYRVIRHNDGAERWIHGQGELEFDQAGNVRRMIGTIQDITRRKQDEMALQKTNALLSTIIETVPAPIFGVDLEGRVHAVWNHAAEAMLGWSAEEVMGRFLPTVPSDNLEEFTSFREQIRKGLVLNGVEVRRLKRDGTPIEYRIFTTPLRDPEGTIFGNIAVLVDDTEMKRANRALLESRTILKATFESMQEGVLVVTGATQVSQYNSKFKEIWGIPDDIVARHDDKLMVEFATSKVINPEQFLSEIKMIYQSADISEGILYFKDGRVIERSSYPLVADGKNAGRVWIFRDITERKQAETALQQSEARVRQLNEELEKRVNDRTAQLQSANKELEAFAYSVSHDLRAPLRAISGYTRILMEDYETVLDDEGKRFCRVISEEGRRMGQLIDDLLEFSRLGRTEMQKAPVDMNALVDSVFRELTAAEDMSRIKFHKEQLANTEADPNLLRQVWANLLSNALKFSHNCPIAEIEVGSSREGDKINYWVRDNGAGFDMRYRDKLFGVFQRLHSTSEFEGTGVGLAIVQRIIHRHGGEVWAVGEVGQGATFSFSLLKKGDEA